MKNEIGLLVVIVAIVACERASTDVYPKPAQSSAPQQPSIQTSPPAALSPALGQTAKPTSLCEDPDLKRCLRLAISSRAGYGGQVRDPQLALAMAYELCLRNSPDACNRLGAWSSGTAALSAYRKACELGATSSCWPAGNILSHPELYQVPSDWLLAMDLLIVACDGGNCGACESLAERFSSGNGFPKNAERAVQYTNRTLAPECELH